MVHETRLDAKIAAVNNAHDYASKLYETLTPFFSQYVGQKIYKGDGTLLKRISDAMPAFPETGLSRFQLHTYGDRSDYSLAWTIKTAESVKERDDYNTAIYYETTVYIGDVRDGVLEKIKIKAPYRSDFTSEEVLSKIQDVKAAEKRLSEAQSAMWPFKENDSY